MPRTSKVISKEQREQRTAFGQFVLRKIREEFPPPFPLYQAYEAIARDTGVALNTIERIIKGEHGAGIDIMVPLARRLGCTVAEMLVIPERKAQRPGLRVN